MPFLQIFPCFVKIVFNLHQLIFRLIVGFSISVPCSLGDFLAQGLLSCSRVCTFAGHFPFMANLLVECVSWILLLVMPFSIEKLMQGRWSLCILVGETMWVWWSFFGLWTWRIPPPVCERNWEMRQISTGRWTSPYSLACLTWSWWPLLLRCAWSGVGCLQGCGRVFWHLTPVLVVISLLARCQLWACRWCHQTNIK